MFEMDDDYIKEVNANYWVEEEEMKTGVHPSQIIERIQKVLDESGVKKKITFMDYSGFSGTRVGVFVDKEFSLTKRNNIVLIFLRQIHIPHKVETMKKSL